MRILSRFLRKPRQNSFWEGSVEPARSTCPKIPLNPNRAKGAQRKKEPPNQSESLSLFGFPVGLCVPSSSCVCSCKQHEPVAASCSACFVCAAILKKRLEFAKANQVWKTLSWTILVKKQRHSRNVFAGLVQRRRPCTNAQHNRFMLFAAKKRHPESFLGGEGGEEMGRGEP